MKGRYAAMWRRQQEAVERPEEAQDVGASPPIAAPVSAK
jgi:hypothetical protein